MPTGGRVPTCGHGRADTDARAALEKYLDGLSSAPDGEVLSELAGPMCDFRRADLSGLDLSRAHLFNANLEGVRLVQPARRAGDRRHVVGRVKVRTRSGVRPDWIHAAAASPVAAAIMMPVVKWPPVNQPFVTPGRRSTTGWRPSMCGRKQNHRCVTTAPAAAGSTVARSRASASDRSGRSTDAESSSKVP